MMCWHSGHTFTIMIFDYLSHTQIQNLAFTMSLSIHTRHSNNLATTYTGTDCNVLPAIPTVSPSLRPKSSNYIPRSLFEKDEYRGDGIWLDCADFSTQYCENMNIFLKPAIRS